MASFQNTLISKRNRWNFLIILALFLILTSIACESQSTADENPPEASEKVEDPVQDTPNEEIPEPLVDSSLIGSWRNTDFGTEDIAMSFEIDSLGSITYYRKNQLTGKFEQLLIEKDKISTSTNIVTFEKSNLCESPLDSLYEFKNDTLFMALQRFKKIGKDRFIPVDFSTYIGTIRPASSMIATITSNFPSGAVVYNHDASSEYELVSGFYSENVNNLFSFADNEFGCHTPADSSNQIFLSTEEIIDGPGAYTLSWIALQLTDFDTTFSRTGINSFNGIEHPLIDGGLEVTLYEEIENFRHIQGVFSFSLEAESQGEKYTVDVTDGSFDVYLKPNP